MTERRWSIDDSAGQLLLHTGVSGRAAKMGHRLTVAMDRWHVEVCFDHDRPVRAALDVEVASFRVLRGEGGLTPLTAPEKALVRSNALSCLDARRHPRIRFEATAITATDAGYRLDGVLAVLDRRLDHTVQVTVAEDGDGVRIGADTAVRHSAAGVRRYSMLMGGLQVADEVGVSLTAHGPRP